MVVVQQALYNQGELDGANYAVLYDSALLASIGASADDAAQNLAGHVAELRGWKQHHPLVKRIQRPAMDPGRSGFQSSSQPSRPLQPTVAAARGFEAPSTSGVRFHGLLTVSLGGNGSIASVINTTGGVAQGTATVPSYLVSFP
jgi:hypothetical protein